MMKTNKWLLGAVLGAVSALATTPSWAAFASVSKSSTVASVTTGGTPVVSMSIQVRNQSNDAAATGMTWTGISIPVGGTTTWRRSAQYIELTSVLTNPAGGIQVYTDNKSASAPVPYTGTGVAAGLVDGGLTTKTLPTAWTIRDLANQAPNAVDPNVDSSTSNVNATFLGWKYHKDPGSSLASGNQLVPGEDYATAKDANLGIHFGSGPADYGPTSSPDYIFVEADFALGSVGRTYSGLIVVEAFTE